MPYARHYTGITRVWQAKYPIGRDSALRPPLRPRFPPVSAEVFAPFPFECMHGPSVCHLFSSESPPSESLLSRGGLLFPIAAPRPSRSASRFPSPDISGGAPCSRLKRRAPPAPPPGSQVRPRPLSAEAPTPEAPQRPAGASRAEPLAHGRPPSFRRSPASPCRDSLLSDGAARASELNPPLFRMKLPPSE